MHRYSPILIEEVRNLRSQGKTYGEIRKAIKIDIPKSTLYEWCKNTTLPDAYSSKILQLNLDNLNKARTIANEINKIKREEYLKLIETTNLPIAKAIRDKNHAKIALAMLCLGEASKYNPKTTNSFYFGNANPKVIITFLELLKRCFNFNQNKVRCTVQCRADQDTAVLEEFWSATTHIPLRQFYKTRIDRRTLGKPTKKLNYRGVLRIDYFDNKVRLELESLANLIYNQLLY